MNMTAYEEQILAKMREERRCPVCGLLEDLEFDILRHLQYDVTKNENVRSTIAQAGGFCGFHFRRFRKLANSQTNALLILALIGEYSHHDLDIHVQCRVCEEITSHESRLLETLCTLLHSVDFRVVYEQMAGLCIGHMKEVQRAIDSAADRSWLQSCQLTQMKKAIPGLQQMVERSYFDTNREQRITIPGSIEKFVGRKALGL
jgi:hypothetical protein